MSIIIISGLLPALLLLAYIYWKDPIREPLHWIIGAFALGMASIIPALMAEIITEELIEIILSSVNPRIIAIANSFVCAAIPEECAKFIFLWIIIRKNPYFDEHFDGITYAVSVSLGFAGVENVLYLYDAGGDWMSIALLRSLLSVPGHYAFGVIMGYYFSVFYFTKRSFGSLMLAFIMPIIAHGTYDCILLLQDAMEDYYEIIMLPILLLFCFWLHKFAKNKICTHIDNDKRISYRQ